jgi:hypothetical protein
LYTDFLPIPKKEGVVSHPERACATGSTLQAISVGMQVWLDYHLQKRRFISIFFVPHSRPKLGMLPVWQNHLCLHQWNTDGELSRILCSLATNPEEHEIAASLSGSPKLSKSWKSGAASFSILYTDFLPIPKKEGVVSHPERACATGSTLQHALQGL